MGRHKKHNAKSLRAGVEEYFSTLSYEAPAMISTPTGEVDQEGRLKFATRLLCLPGSGPGIQGAPVTVRHWLRPPSLAGLCLHLGISRDTWASYAQDERMAPVVELARAVMEDYWTAQLEGKGAAGARFALSSNYGWRERHEVEMGPRSARVMTASAAAAMPMEEREALLREMGQLFAQDVPDGDDDESESQ